MKKGLWLLQVTISLCFIYFLINGISSLMSPNFLFVCLFVCLFVYFWNEARKGFAIFVESLHAE